jgi:hypothetical protein
MATAVEVPQSRRRPIGNRDTALLFYSMGVSWCLAEVVVGHAAHGRTVPQVDGYVIRAASACWVLVPSWGSRRLGWVVAAPRMCIPSSQFWGGRHCARIGAPCFRRCGLHSGLCRSSG